MTTCASARQWMESTIQLTHISTKDEDWSRAIAFGII